MAFRYYSQFNKKRKNSKQFSKRIVLFFIYLLLGFLRFLGLFFSLLARLWPVLVVKPGRRILRFIFYKIVIKAYRFYLYILKKLGWQRRKIAGLAYLRQRLVHLAVVVLTIILVYANTAMRTAAQAPSPLIKKTILASIVQSEFGSLEQGGLVEETVNAKELAFQLKSASQRSPSLKAPLAVTPAGLNNDSANNLAPALAWRGLNADSLSAAKTPLPTSQPDNEAVKRRDKIITYTVQSGDTVSTIAQKFGITANTILWENKLSPYALIHPGDKLRILPISGITHTVKKGETIGHIARVYKVDLKDILQANHLKITSTLAIGQKLIIPGGQKRTYASYQTKSYSGLSVIKKLVQRPKRAPVYYSNKMAWPTVGHRITQYFSWRHNGLDIANHIGTPIFAADAGVVEYAGWGRGYGKYILLNHGGGKKTRYAHLSKFYVHKGQRVSKGQTIAAMGSTGWSTGPHVHFEVIINGRRYNPLNYIR